MTKTHDILTTIGQLNPRPFTVGFAAETQHLLANAQSKLIGKQADMIVANLISKDHNPFNNDSNAVTILQKNCEPIHLPYANKNEIAKGIVNAIKNNRDTLASSKDRSLW